MRIRKSYKILTSALLVISLIARPFFGVSVLAEAEVANDNQAVVDNNVQTTANTGDNNVVPEPTVTPIPSITPVEEVVVVEISPTPTPAQLVIVDNDNQAVIDNTATVSATTGENTVDGPAATVDTGDAATEMDVVNVIDTNITGNNFEQVILNVDQGTLGDLDLSGVEINIASADFLSALAVYNTNNATLVNNLQLIANSGGNQIVGPNGEILTGDALANLNLFNLVNTNLTGQDWFFGVINLMGDFEGNIILPYEWQFLGEEGSATSITGSTEISNFNQANVENNINVTANSGNNQIVGSGDINTGNASAQTNLINFVNTNITGSRWLLLAINNFGTWQGELEGWWGNVQMIPGTMFAWVKLPDLPGGIGDSLLVNNNNSASVENNIEVAANTGDNQINGVGGSINTGNAQASADVLNVVNTNITGNNWYFGMINIFDDFLGNIIFPRPDLTVIKTADKSEVLPGEEITYTLTYKNQGRLWAKNTLITDSLSAGTTFISASDGGINQNGSVVWNIGSINSGQSGAVSVKVKVDTDIAAGTKLVNHVSLGTSTYEMFKDNNSSSAETLVMAKESGGIGGTSNGNDSGGSGLSGSPSAGGSSDTVSGGSSVLLSANTGTGYLPGVLGVQAAEGELGEASSTDGEVAGAATKPNRPWWLILLSVGAGTTGGYFWLLKRRAQPRNFSRFL